MLNEALGMLGYIHHIELHEMISYLKTLTKYKEQIYDFLDIMTDW